MGNKFIHWFKQDLRVSDNPALSEVVSRGEVLPVFIWDDITAPEFLPGAASRWWLHHSLQSLNDSLGGKLNIYKGEPIDILRSLIKNVGCGGVTWNCCYEPWQYVRDEKIADMLEQEGTEVSVFNATLLWDPAEVLKADGTPYKVFTPFYRKGCLGAAPPARPLPEPALSGLIHDADSLAVDDLELLPEIRWDSGFSNHWKPGEKGAFRTLERFVRSGLGDYKEGRNFPAKKNVSRLSPHLRWGEIAPNKVWHEVRGHVADENADHFCSELGWREFSYNLLFHIPDLPHVNLNRKFDAFPWENDSVKLKAWQNGQTGIPIVDAGMRELWQTGYIHNRVRMVVASFLVKNLLIHWHHGEAWFWDTLVDADLANNSASWQWVAGCGADAAPYFRIFNPVTQGQKFDPEGGYIRKYVPEIGKLPNKYLCNPWDAPEPVLSEAGIELGKTYPQPIADLKVSRENALAAYAMLKDVSRS